MIIAGMVQSPHPMRALSSNKILIAALAFVALAALTILASGLGGMDFRAGQQFGAGTANGIRAAAIEAISNMQAVPFQTQLLVLILLVILFALIGLLLSPEMRKRLLNAVIRAALTVWLLSMIFTRYPNILSQLGLNLSALNAESSETATGAAAPEFTPPQSASWWAYVLSFGLLLLVLFIAWKAYSFWKELNAPSSDLAKGRIAKIARASILDLSAGRESSDVILNCYYRMSDAVSHRKNLNRNASMTPSEFAARLEAEGIPSDAVRALTRLFESVRYGGQRSNPNMVSEAVACLTSILQHCGEPV